MNDERRKEWQTLREEMRAATYRVNRAADDMVASQQSEKAKRGRIGSLIVAILSRLMPYRRKK